MQQLVLETLTKPQVRGEGKNAYAPEDKRNWGKLLQLRIGSQLDGKEIVAKIRLTSKMQAKMRFFQHLTGEPAFSRRHECNLQDLLSRLK